MSVVNSFLLPGAVGVIEAKAEESPNASAKLSVIICHPHPLYGGTMENKVVTTLFRTFREMGAYVVRFNYRGVGKSEGKYAAGIGETEDLLAVAQWIKKTRPNDTIWLAGFSFGSYVATRAAKAVNAQQLLTVAPAVEHFDFDSIDYPQCPWLVIQGTEDEVVPSQLVFDWIAKQSHNRPKLIKFENAGHFFHGRLTELKQTLLNEYQNKVIS